MIFLNIAKLSLASKGHTVLPLFFFYSIRTDWSFKICQSLYHFTSGYLKCHNDIASNSVWNKVYCSKPAMEDEQAGNVHMVFRKSVHIDRLAWPISFLRWYVRYLTAHYRDPKDSCSFSLVWFEQSPRLEYIPLFSSLRIILLRAAYLSYTTVLGIFRADPFTIESFIII